MDGSNTTSSLRLVPTADDHDAELICSAVNPLLGVANTTNTGNGIETRRKLVVHCKSFSFFKKNDDAFFILFLIEKFNGRRLAVDDLIDGNRPL